MGSISRAWRGGQTKIPTVSYRSDRVPMFGFMSAKKLTIQKTGDPNYLPVAHTCFNLLDLPEYATKSKLKYKLLQAIQGTQGFGLVWNFKSISNFYAENYLWHK